MVDEKFFAKYDINVSRETFDRLKIFHDTLLCWNQRHNLVSQTTVTQIWTRHILDSAQLVNFISNRHQTIVDLGSGAGFPGIIIAIIKNIPVILVESNLKKCSFLKEIQRLLNLDLKILSERIENVISLQADIITSRALSSLGNLLKFSNNHLTSRGKCLFLKGENVDLEITMAQQQWHFDFLKHISLSNPKGNVLEITNIKQLF